MSVLVIPSKISSLEETLQYSLKRISILIDDVHSEFTKMRVDFTKISSYHFKSHERLHTILTTQIQIMKCQTQPHMVPGSYLSLFKVTSVNIGHKYIKAPIDVSSGIGPNKSHLQTHTLFVTSFSYDHAPEFTMYTSHKIVFLYNLAPDVSYRVFLGRGITQVFYEPLPPDCSCHDYKKLT